jgi:iron complex outermembrane receptor protein
MLKRLLTFSVGVLLALTPAPAESTDPAAMPAAESDGAAGARDEQPEAESEYVEVNVSHVPESSTIISKLPLSLQMTPANVGTVSSTLVGEQNGYYLTDALRNVSSLNVQAQGGVHDFFLVRGYDSVSGSLVMTDGAVEPEATWYPMYNVVGVEVLKGPAGFLYGSDPLAGAVNIVRKQPLPTSFAEFGFTYGSFNRGEATVDWNLANDDGTKNFRLNAMGYQTDNYREVGESEQVAINPSFTWEFGDDSRLNFNLEYVDADFAPDSGIPLVSEALPDVPRDRAYQTPFDFSEQTIGRFQVDYETRLTERVRLRNKFYYRDLDWQTAGTQFAGTFPTLDGSVAAARLQTWLDDRQQFTGNQTEAVFELRTGTVTHNLLAGVDLRYFTDTFEIGFVPPQDPFNPQIPGIPAIDLFQPVETAQPLDPFPFLNGDSTSRVIAPYLTDQITFSERFQVLAGARYDVISRDDDRTLFNPFTREEISRDDAEVSPLLGLVYAPTESLSLYANAARSYAPAGVRVFGELEPERSTGFELGAKKQYLDGKLRSTLAIYQLERDNLAIPDDTGVTQQAGDQRSRGVEFELAAEPLTRFRVFLAYAYTDAELTNFTERVIVGFDPGTGQPIEATVDRSGNTPAFVPKNLLNLWLSKTLRNGLGIGGGARFIGEQYVAEDNEGQIDSALVFDATVFYDFSSVRLSVNFKNLTDEEYEVRGFGSTSVIPADPFSVFVGARFRM